MSGPLLLLQPSSFARPGLRSQIPGLNQAKRNPGAPFLAQTEQTAALRSRFLRPEEMQPGRERAIAVPRE